MLLIMSANQEMTQSVAFSQNCRCSSSVLTNNSILCNNRGKHYHGLFVCFRDDSTITASSEAAGLWCKFFFPPEFSASKLSDDESHHDTSGSCWEKGQTHSATCWTVPHHAPQSVCLSNVPFTGCKCISQCWLIGRETERFTHELWLS